MSFGFLSLLPLLLTATPDETLLQTLHAMHVCAQSAAGQSLARSASDDVKRYAREVNEGHRAADQAVKTLADKLGLKLVPPAAEDASREEAEELGGLQGRGLDKAFLRVELASHARAVSDLEATRSTLNDKLVRRLCDQELHVLRALEEKARKLEEKL